MCFYELGGQKNRISDDFCLPLKPNCLCFRRCGRNKNRFAVDGVMQHDRFCFALQEGCITQVDDLLLRLCSSWCRILQMLRGRAAQQADSSQQQEERLYILFHDFHNREFFSPHEGKFYRAD